MTATVPAWHAFSATPRRACFSTLSSLFSKWKGGLTLARVHIYAGLDARAAAIVMRTVRNTVNTGRTVVCTIHQPSIDIFEVCFF